MNQPKYITYRGAKYERVNTLNEIIVGPLPECCVIEFTKSNSNLQNPLYKFVRGYAKNIGEKQLEDYSATHHRSKRELIEIDRYTYYGNYSAYFAFMVCTDKRGEYGHVYSLAKDYDKYLRQYQATGELSIGYVESKDNLIRVLTSIFNLHF